MDLITIAERNIHRRFRNWRAQAIQDLMEQRLSRYRYLPSGHDSGNRYFPRFEPGGGLDGDKDAFFAAGASGKAVSRAV